MAGHIGCAQIVISDHMRHLTLSRRKVVAYLKRCGPCSAFVPDSRVTTDRRTSPRAAAEPAERYSRTASEGLSETDIRISVPPAFGIMRIVQLLYLQEIGDRAMPKNCDHPWVRSQAQPRAWMKRESW